MQALQTQQHINSMLSSHQRGAAQQQQWAQMQQQYQSTESKSTPLVAQQGTNTMDASPEGGVAIAETVQHARPQSILKLRRGKDSSRRARGKGVAGSPELNARLAHATLERVGSGSSVYSQSTPGDFGEAFRTGAMSPVRTGSISPTRTGSSDSFMVPNSFDDHATPPLPRDTSNNSVMSAQGVPRPRSPPPRPSSTRANSARGPIAKYESSVDRRGEVASRSMDRQSTRSPTRISRARSSSNSPTRRRVRFGPDRHHVNVQERVFERWLVPEDK